MYDMQPPQPVQMPAPPESKRMSVPQIMLIVLVLAFALWYLVTALTPESSPYATITAGVIGSRYTGDCLIVRDETPFDAEGVSSVDYIAEEGSMVSRGTTVCNVYSSGFSTREMNVKVIGMAFVMATAAPEKKRISGEKALMTLEVTDGDPAEAVVRPAEWLR